MTEGFESRFRARWVDMDFNQHMRNAAFLGCAEETRMLFLEQQGWTMAEFQSQGIGPVVLDDHLHYRKELRLLEAFRVDLLVCGATTDFARMKLRNTFYRETDSSVCAVVESLVVWLDLKTRKPIAPPETLRSAWEQLALTQDFVSLDR